MTLQHLLVTRNDATMENIDAYLPRNFSVVAPAIPIYDSPTFVVAGVDVAGWTLADYVIPRLQSGSFGVEEITGSRAASTMFKFARMARSSQRDLGHKREDVASDAIGAKGIAETDNYAKGIARDLAAIINNAPSVGGILYKG